MPIDPLKFMEKVAIVKKIRRNIYFVSARVVTDKKLLSILSWDFENKYVYGPVVSRRFGISIGINPFPLDATICNLSCSYCIAKVAPSNILKGKRIARIVKPDIIIKELKRCLDNFSRLNLLNILDSIGLCGNGEPLLYPYIDDLVKMLRLIANDYNLLLGIFTNGTLETLRRLEEYMDIIIVKLDALNLEYFNKINNPHCSISNILFENLIKNILHINVPFSLSIAVVNGECGNRDHLLSIEFYSKLQNIVSKNEHIRMIQLYRPHPPYPRSCASRSDYRDLLLIAYNIAKYVEIPVAVLLDNIYTSVVA